MPELIKRIGKRFVVCPEQRIVRKSFKYSVFIVVSFLCFVFFAETLVIYSSITGQEILNLSEGFRQFAGWVAEFFIQG
ncbi:MAG: hypothetical protein ACOCSE_02125 [Chitinivibrionales bacterium]